MAAGCCSCCRFLCEDHGFFHDRQVPVYRCKSRITRLSESDQQYSLGYMLEQGDRTHLYEDMWKEEDPLLRLPIGQGPLTTWNFVYTSRIT